MHRSSWKLPTFVLLAGALVGWATGVAHANRVQATSPLIETEIVSVPETSSVAVVRVPAALSVEERQSRELARLRARNRHLEVLLREMRDREVASSSELPQQP